MGEVSCVADYMLPSARNARLAIVGAQGLHKNSGSHIDASHSRRPLAKGERLVRYEVNAVMPNAGAAAALKRKSCF